jgi:hypothetical protein
MTIVDNVVTTIRLLGVAFTLVAFAGLVVGIRRHWSGGALTLFGFGTLCGMLATLVVSLA